MKHFFLHTFLRWFVLLLLACIFGAIPIFGPIARQEALYIVSQTRPKEGFCVSSLAQEELCIPKIRIRGEIIEEDSLNLASINNKLQNGIVHLEASAKPGEYGNGAYFGHSDDVPWDKGPYKTIFALLNKLEPHDEIFLFHEGEIFRYTVVAKQIVVPSDTSVLSADNQTKQITLITCWPPGTTSKRLVVTAHYEP